MYNFYRWYPRGKIVFLAPTKPLVMQQLEACFKITGIPTEDTAHLEGSVHSDDRVDLWRSKRVFFSTPQTFLNDLLRPDIALASQLVCVVIDEAHRAQGKYAYCEAVSKRVECNKCLSIH